MLHFKTPWLKIFFIMLTLTTAPLFADSSIPCSEMPPFTYIKSAKTLPNADLDVQIHFPFAFRFARCSTRSSNFFANARDFAYLKIRFLKNFDSFSQNINTSRDYFEFLNTKQLFENSDYDDVGLSSKTHPWMTFLHGHMDSQKGLWHTWTLAFGEGDNTDYLIHHAVIPGSRRGGYKVVLAEKYEMTIERYSSFDSTIEL